MTAQLFHSDQMPLELQLSDATGILHPAARAQSGGDDDPLLAGCVYFDMSSRRQASVLRIPVQAWLDVQGGKLRYRLSFAGIPGWMTLRMRVAGAGPDYVGAAGLKDELQVAGWRNKLQPGEVPSLTLVLHSSALGSELIDRLVGRNLGGGH